MGTPLYMSPEALLGSEMTTLSDQYSLGVVLYECATGVNPFIAGSVAETARRVTTGQFTPLADQPIRPSRRLQAIIERAMSLDPGRRFPDMRAFGQELLQLAGQRTRITWGLTFGTVAVAARANHTRDLDDGTIALAKTRPPKRASHFQAWPMLVAAGVGVATMVALFSWSARREAADRSANVAATPELASATPYPSTQYSSAQYVAPLRHGSASAASAAGMPAGLAEARQRPAAVDLDRGSSALPSVARPSSLSASALEAVAPSDGLSLGGVAPAPSTNEKSVPASGAPNAGEARNDDGAVVSVAPPASRGNPAAPSPRPEPVHVEPPRLAPALDSLPEPNEPPEWLIERSSRRRSPAALPSERGTNNAFIFD
jgi:serine/threonine-protein kinase